MAPDSDGVFLCDEFLGFCFFQYNLNSRFSICNSGQTLTSRLFREKIKENHFVYSLVKRRLALTCFRIAGRWSKTLDESLCDVKQNYYEPWHRSFADFFLLLDEINLWSCHSPICCFFILSLLTDSNRLKSFIFKHDIAIITFNLHVLMLQKYQPSFLIYNSRQYKQ